MLSQRLAHRAPLTREQIRDKFLYERFSSASLLVAAGIVERCHPGIRFDGQERKHVMRALTILDTSGFASPEAFLRSDPPEQAYVIEFMMAFFPAESPEEAAARCAAAHANVLALCHQGLGDAAAAADFLRALHQVGMTRQPHTVRIRRA